MEYTQEQIDALVAEKVKEATNGLYTEDDFQRKLTAEVDRRVDSGIKKGIETQKSKWLKEYEEQAKLSAEELAEKKLKEQMETLSQKEKTILQKENQLLAKDRLSEAGIPKEHYEKFIGMLVTDDSEVTSENVQNFVDTFNATKTEIESRIKSEYSDITPPTTGNSDDVVTKEKFDSMSYADKLSFKQDNPEQYKEFIKS